MKKKVKILGVPIDLGSKKLGVDMGPNSIRYAGLTKALDYNNIDYFDFGNLKLDNNNNLNVREIVAAYSNMTAKIVYNAVKDNYIAIVLGGDHSVSIGSIAGASKIAKKLGVIWLDFHPDANTPETSPSGNIHGMTVAISLGYGYPELVNCMGFKPKINPKDILLVGVKDIDKKEKQFLHQQGIKMYTLYDIDKNGVYHVMDDVLKRIEKCDYVHLSLDVDVLDPIIAPGTGILSKGGLSYREISYIMETLGRNNIITSLDIIEVNPLLDKKNITAELAVELIISAIGGRYGDYERLYLEDASIGI